MSEIQNVFIQRQLELRPCLNPVTVRARNRHWVALATCSSESLLTCVAKLLDDTPENKKDTR